MSAFGATRICPLDIFPFTLWYILFISIHVNDGCDYFRLQSGQESIQSDKNQMSMIIDLIDLTFYRFWKAFIFNLLWESVLRYWNLIFFFVKWI
jgi:hypothetical protein